MKAYWLARGVKFALIAAVAATLASVGVMALWNWVVAASLGARAITLGQAFGLLVLSRILLGRFPGGMGRRLAWRHRMRERWEKMSPEQRQQFVQGLQGRCGQSETHAPTPVS